MNEPLSQDSLSVLSSPHFVVLPENPLKWARQVIQAHYGNEYNPLFKTTLEATIQAFTDVGLIIPTSGGFDVGDLLFRTNCNAGKGACGFVIPGNRVSECSIVHWNGRDARGIRYIKEFGEPDAIVRFPARLTLLPPNYVIRG